MAPALDWLPGAFLAIGALVSAAAIERLPRTPAIVRCRRIAARVKAASSRAQAAGRRTALSSEDFESWLRLFECYGSPGLRANGLRRYPDPCGLGQNAWRAMGARAI